MKLSSTDIQILKILSGAMNNSPIDKITNWSEVLKELKKHAVFCLPYEVIKKYGGLSKTETEVYKKICYKNIAQNMQILNEQTRMVNLFEENNIPFVVLKGASAAIYYPHPEYRSMGDIDIIVKQIDFDRAMEMLNQNYKCIQTIEDNPRHAGFVSKNGVQIELHKFFSFGERTEKKNLLDQMIYDGIDHREWGEISGHRFPCLQSNENGLVLLNHIYQHLQGSGVGYRQIIDFRQFVESEKDNMDTFLSAAKKVGLSGLAEALIIVYKKYMRVNIDIVTSQFSDETIEELMNAFINSGNFGSKDLRDGSRQAELVMKHAKNLFSMFRLLQTNGRNHWEASETYILLRPFAWIYQIGYYVKQVRKAGGISVIIKGKKRLSGKEKLYNELGL